MAGPAALIVAAGSGARLGLERPKAFVELAGQPMLRWSLRAIGGVPSIERVVVALPEGWAEGVETAQVEVECVRGGPTRSASVKSALARAGECDPVLVHDAARPLATPELFERALAELDAGGCDGAVVAAPVTDTVKRTDDEGTVRETLDRSTLWAVQTPQAFRREALERALDVSDDVLDAATDDAWLVERIGGRVRVVAGPATNIKVTTSVDLQLAELLLSERS